MRRAYYTCTLGLSLLFACTPPTTSKAPALAPELNAAGAPEASAESHGWSAVPEILARIVPPKFPDRECRIDGEGAIAGGVEDATAAIHRAIASCSKQGGGRVVVPPGVYRTGAIQLESNIELHVSEGATLRFDPNPERYLPPVLTRWEGIECINYSPLIYALDRENVAITGKGTLDGSAGEGNWWSWAKKGKDGKSRASPDVKALNMMSEAQVPVEQRVFGAGHYLRPSFIQVYRTKNVLIEDIKIVRSPMWEIHPVLSSNVTVRGVEITSHGPNNDGCNPDSSTDVLIENAVFDVGDDCIAIKSGRNEDGRRVGKPSANIVIRNSTMRDGHAGVAIGSEIAGGCHDVYIEGARMDSPNLDRALRLKSNARRGGLIENIFMRNVQIGRVSEALLTIDFLYEEGPRGDFPPTARHVVIEGVRASSSPRLFHIRGFEGATIDHIRVADSEILNVTAPEVIEHAGRIEVERVRVLPAVLERSLSSRPASEY